MTTVTSSASRLAMKAVVVLAATAFVLISASTTSAAPSGLIAAYAFDEGAGTSVADASGNGNNGTVSNTSWAAGGKYGKALSFNGSSSRVTIPDSASLHLTTAMTLEAWVDPTTVNAAWRDLIYKGNDNYYLEASSTPGGRPAGGGIIGGSYVEAYGTANLPAASWTHVALTYDGSAVRLFVNGTQVASTAKTGALATSTNPLQIGGDSLYGQYFAGLIDEVRVYNVALTAAQIQADLARPVVPPAADTTPPSAPGTLSGSAASSSRIDLGWVAASDDVGVSGYRIERCQGAGCSNFAQIATVAGSTLSYADTGLNPSSGYSYRVRAADAAGNLGPYSNTLSATTQAAADTTPPSAPGTLSGSAASSSRIDLGWVAASDDVGVSGYRIERCQGAGCSNFAQIATVAGSTLSYADTGLNPSSGYSYRVRAADAAGNLGPYSNTLSATTQAAADTTPPSAPGTLSGSAASSSRIDLGWVAASDDVGVSGYRIERCQGAGCSNFAQIATVAGSTLSYADTGLNPSSGYSYRVRAADAAGNLGPYSNTLSATTQAAADTTPVAAYAFDEGAGTSVADASGNGNNGTVSNTSWAAGGKYGKALSFNGSSSRVTIPDSASLHLTTAMTLEAWVDPTTVNAAWRDLIYKGNDNYYLEASSTPGGRPAGGGIIGGSYVEAYGTANLPAASWTHVALTYDGSAVRLFVNGTQVASTAKTGALATSTNPLQIGGDSLYGQYFAGLIDEVRVYNVALTAAQIQADLARPVVPPAADTTPPSAPGTLSGSAASSSRIDLGWVAASDDVGVSGYRIERCQGAGCSNFAQIATVAGSTLSYADTGLNPSSGYSYRVRAADAAGNLGPYSNTLSATTQAAADTTPPSAPGTLSGSAASSSRIDLGWVAASDDVGVSGYRIERCQGAGCSNFAQIATVAGSTLSYADTGLNPSSGYSYRVRAADAAGNLGPYSNTLSATTQAAADTTPPSAPGTLSGSAASSSRIDLGWVAASDDVGVSGYRIERCQGAGCSNFAQIATVAGSTLSYADTGLNPSSGYSYRVRAADAAGNLGPYSNTLSATTQAAADTTPPSAPGTLSGSAASSSRIDLGWVAASDDVGVSGYRIERCQGAGCSNFAQIATVAGSTLSYADTGLNPSSGYSYRVRAADAAGNLGPYSNTLSATTQAAADTTPPSAPGTLSGSAASSSRIDLGWVAASDDVGVSGYRIERCQGAGCSNFAQIATVAGSTLSYADTGLNPSSGYSYRVRAADAAGNLGPYSNTLSATTSAGSTADSDDFNRADGGLGANWADVGDGGLSISSQALVGSSAGVAGDIWTGQTYAGDQYSQVAVTSTQLTGGQWIGPAVRAQNGGQDTYLGIYFWNSGSPQLRLYERTAGTWAQLGGSYNSGPLAAGTQLKLVAVGSEISFLQNGVVRIEVTDNSLTGGAPGIIAFGAARADNWSGGIATSSSNPGFQVDYQGTDANGVATYDASSPDDGGTQALRVLAPTNPAPGVPHNFLYVLPVEAGLGTTYGDGLESLRALNAQNQYNLTIIEPSFGIEPWYADNPNDATVRYETFMTKDLLPWVTQNLALTGHEQNWLIGFSKSGIGGEDLILKHPDLFTLAASWDFPADMSSYNQYGPSSANSYGTDANFQSNYRLTPAFVSAHKTPFLSSNRIWIGGYAAFQTDITDYDALLTSNGIAHTTETPTSMVHRWDSGWVPIALAALSQDSLNLTGT